MSMDVAGLSVATTPDPMPGPSVGVVNGVSGLLGGTLRVGAAGTNQAANILESSAGPAVMLVVAGMVLAWFVRRR